HARPDPACPQQGAALSRDRLERMVPSSATSGVWLDLADPGLSTAMTHLQTALRSPRGQAAFPISAIFALSQLPDEIVLLRGLFARVGDRPRSIAKLVDPHGGIVWLWASTCAPSLALAEASRAWHLQS